MNWYSQLTQLIFDFYREDPNELKQLSSLRHCKISRRWGVLRIDCRDRNTVEHISNASSLLETPIAELRLANQINLLLNGSLVAVMPVTATRTKMFEF